VTYTLYGTALGYSSIWSNIATISVDPLYSLEKSPSTNRAQVNFSIIGTDPIVRKVALDKAVQP
jgi:predicted O-methyltransferase YrrM